MHRPLSVFGFQVWPQFSLRWVPSMSIPRPQMFKIFFFLGSIWKDVVVGMQLIYQLTFFNSSASSVALPALIRALLIWDGSGFWTLTEHSGTNIFKNNFLTVLFHSQEVDSDSHQFGMLMNTPQLKHHKSLRFEGLTMIQVCSGVGARLSEFSGMRHMVWRFPQHIRTAVNLAFQLLELSSKGREVGWLSFQVLFNKQILRDSQHGNGLSLKFQCRSRWCHNYILSRSGKLEGQYF